MKKQLNEFDFIGGQKPLTKKEEQALATYFASQKSKTVKRNHTSAKSKSYSSAFHH